MNPAYPERVMDAPSLLDHAIVLGLLVLLPLNQHLGRDLLRAMGSWSTEERVRFYHRMAILQWSLTLGLLAYWWSRGRSWRELGFGADFAPGVLAGGLLAGGALAAFRFYHHRQLADGGRRARLRHRMDRIAPFLPRTRAGLPAFDRLSVTAGICEEILFRGFLIWYAGAWLGTSPPGLAAAVILTSLLFAFVHLYQGIAGMLTVAAVGLLQGTIFVLSGSLWIPMLLHALVDALAGRLSLRLHPEGEPGADAWGGRRAVLAAETPPGERATGTAGRDA